MRAMKFFDLFKVFIPICLICCCVSCKDDNEISNQEGEQEENAVVSCPVDNILFDADGGMQTLSFSTNKDWSIKVLGNITWCAISSSFGSTGTHSINVSVERNVANIERNATLVILCGDITYAIEVTQKQQNAFILNLGEDKTIEIDSNGGTVGIEVKTNVDYEIEIIGDATQWIKEMKSRSMASFSHIFSISSNEKPNSRNGIIQFKTSDEIYSVKVVQGGTADTPVLILDTKKYVVSDSGETIIVEVQSNVDFGVKMPDVDWIQIVENARSLSSRTLKFIVIPNDTYNERSAEIVVYDKNSELKDTLQVVQKQKDILILTEDEVELEQVGSEFTVGVNTNVEYSIEIPQDAKKWVNFVNSRTLVAYSHRFVVAANDTYIDRVTEITFKDLNGKLTKTLTVKQEQNDLLLVQKKYYDINAKKDTVEIEVEANINFDVQINVDWITLIKQTKVADRKHVLSFEVGDNLMQQNRSGQIIIINEEKGLSQTIDLLQRMEGQESDQKPEGSVGDMNWG